MNGKGMGSAVSPVVAVILMVAVTVLLSAAVGTFVFDIGQSLDESSTTQNIGVSTGVNGTNVTVQVISGTADKIELVINGTVKDNITSPHPGDTLSANITTDSQVAVIATTEGAKRLISTTNPLSSQTISSSSGILGPTANLTAYWKLDGDTTDSVGGYNGTLNNGASFVTDAERGEVLQFDGVDSSMSHGYVSGIDGTDKFTIAWWQNLNSTSSNQLISQHGLGTDNNNAYQIFWDFSSNLGLKISVKKSNNWKDTYNASLTPPTGTWVHYSVVFDSGTVSFYQNGSLIDSNSLGYSTLAVSDTKVSQMGYATSGAYPLNGSLSDVRIYNKSLSSAEVNDLYEATK